MSKLSKQPKMKKQPYHADFEPNDENPLESPNFGKLIFIRMAFCILVGAAIAIGLVSLAVILVNKIMEQ